MPMTPLYHSSVCPSMYQHNRPLHLWRSFFCVFEQVLRKRPRQKKGERCGHPSLGLGRMGDGHGTIAPAGADVSVVWRSPYSLRLRGLLLMGF